MNIIAEIGSQNSMIAYRDRPTVKVIIKDGNKFLILNSGLLPGGGIDDDKTDIRAIERELTEELGASVKNIESIGCVIQYRYFLERRYIINGYTADLVAFDKVANPQDSGEEAFTYRWLEKDAALKLVQSSIDSYIDLDIVNDTQQGRLFNLKTSLELLLSMN